MKNKEIIGYYLATKNEIAIDLQLFRLIGKTPSLIINIPRPSIYLSEWKKSFFKVIFLSPLIFVLFYTAIIFLKILLVKITMKRKKIEHFIPKKLAFSQKAIDIIEATDLQGDWITFPWIKYENFPKGKNLSILYFVNLKDLFSALILSIKAQILFYKREKKWILQTYTAYQWFITNKFVSLQDGDFIIGEHYDRWAVLVDFNLFIKGNTKGLTIVQHGIVNAMSNEKINLFYRLKSVKNLYTYDENSLVFFKKYILITQKDQNISNYFLDSQLKLQQLVNNNHKKTILIVGNNICLTFHKSLLSEIKKRYDNQFIIYYKPHPNDIINQNYYSDKWNIIHDKNYFPKVDFCISYPSTLGYQYKLAGITTIFHEMKELDDVIEVIVEKLINL